MIEEQQASDSVIGQTPFRDDDPLEFTLSKDQDGTRHAINSKLSVTVLNDGDTNLFKRRSIKGVGSGSPSYATCLVAQLDGVCVYIQDDAIVITKQSELKP